MNKKTTIIHSVHKSADQAIDNKAVSSATAFPPRHDLLVRRKRGFSVAQLAIAVGITAVFAGIAVTTGLNVQRESQMTKAKQDIAQTIMAIMSYRARVPNTAQNTTVESLRGLGAPNIFSGPNPFGIKPTIDTSTGHIKYTIGTSIADTNDCHAIATSIAEGNPRIKYSSAGYVGTLRTTVEAQVQIGCDKAVNTAGGILSIEM